MNKKAKNRVLWYVVFLTIFLITWIILYFSFSTLKSSYIGMISAGILAVLSSMIINMKLNKHNKYN